MKILFSTSIFFPSQIGGPANALAWMTKCLKKKGIEVIIITTKFGIRPDNLYFNRWIENDLGKIYYSNYLNWHFPINMILQSIKELKNVDIVHLNSIFYFPEMIIGLCSLLSKKKIIWATEGNLSKNALSRKALKKTLYLTFLKLIFRNKIAFHSSSQLETLDIIRIFGKKYKIIQFPNFIELPIFLKMNTLKQFLWVGRFDPIKNLESLIKAIHLSKEFKRQDYKLLLVGSYENNYGRTIKALVDGLQLNDYVSFLGHLSGERKFQLYATSYFFILPSYSENFGNVVTESLSQGTPVIATHGTPWEILPETKSGYWCSFEAESLSTVIDLSINLSNEEYLVLRNNALELVKKEFSFEHNISKWISAYQSLLNNSDT